MKIAEAIKETALKLESTSLNPQIEAKLLICYILNKPYNWLNINTDSPLTDFVAKQIDLFIRILQLPYPLAYITNQRSFYNSDYFVNTHTLIPRPETELVVDETVSFILKQNRDLKIIEIGTGTGCIAISLLQEMMKARFPKKLSIDAIDRSVDALKVAKYNSKVLLPQLNDNLKINLINKDLFEIKGFNSYDLFISNPPYIPTNELEGAPELDCEPTTALDGGDDGLDFYRYMIERMSGNTHLIAEIHSNKKDAVLEIARRHFPERKDIQVKNDLAGKPRILVI